MAVDVTGLFDVAELLERCLQDAAFAEEMLTIFSTQVPITFGRLETAVRANNPAEASKAAHSLKGSSANLSAHLLQGVAIEMEKTFREGDCSSPQAIALFERGRDVCRRTLDAVPATLALVKARAPGA
jgi:HPt (histidine-containing phosphotransfer) domain-containing protein